jgi:hypothetical protein
VLGPAKRGACRARANELGAAREPAVETLLRPELSVGAATCLARIKPPSEPGVSWHADGGGGPAQYALWWRSARIWAVNTDDELNGSQMLAEVLLRDAERIAERSVARMQELLPAYARVPRDELIPVTLTNTRNLLEAVRDPDADHSREQPAYRASGDVRARQGITSDEMLNAWRIGLEGVREAAHEVADDLGVGNEALLEFVVATLRWGDIGMRASASAHHEAEIRELGRLAEEQTALRRVATQVAQGAPSARLFAVVAEHVARVLRVPLVSIARYEADGTASEWASRSEQGELELSPGGDASVARRHERARGCAPELSVGPHRRLHGAGGADRADVPRGRDPFHGWGPDRRRR